MEIKESFQLINRESYCSGTPKSDMNIYASVRDKPTSQLLKTLESEGIKIDLANSEGVIKYDIHSFKGREEKTSSFPLDMNVTNMSLLIGYDLRNENFEIFLRDIFHSSYQGMEGIIGADNRVTTGVSGVIKYIGSDDKANLKVKKIKNFLLNFYRPKPKGFKTRKLKIENIRTKKGKKKKSR